ncbi:histone H1 [Pedobacter sp. SYSU D00535]|uniref:histone H1 n=1 Tax=Pedobacter sp. SYSU D00535 TaxID=2810308 RepID=UPI001A95737C|nr:histone H1 [Pedobacter sp. SYSU D00535]
MEKFNHLKDLFNSSRGDAEKFYDKQNGAAGTRLRKAMQEIKTLAADIRREVTELKNQEK